jgi:DNA polymerase III subunit epsilon
MYLILDTEAKGMPKKWCTPLTNSKNWPRLAELAWMLYSDDGKKISAGSSKIISDDKAESTAEDGKMICDALSEFSTIVARADVLVAHDMDLAERILGAEFLRTGISNPLDPKEKISMMESSTDLCAIEGPFGIKWPKLEELHHKLFRNGFRETHDAVAVVDATAECFWELKKRDIV